MDTKKLLCFVLSTLSIAFLAVPLFACRGETGQDQTNTDVSEARPNDGGENAAPEDNAADRANRKDSLPDGLDFKGAEYRVLNRSDDDFNTIEFVETEIGEVVNDAIYRRQKSVEGRLNVSIVPVSIPGDWSNKDKFLSRLKSSVNAGDDEFDVVAAYAYYITPFMLEGYFANFDKIPYIDYEKPWWPDSITQHLKIGNKLYFVTGDYTLSLTKALWCFAYNKKVAQDFDVPNLYELVFDGAWTFDEYAKITKSVSKDVNGDGKWGMEDIYGLASRSYDVYFPAFQLPMTETKSDGTLSLAVYNEKFVSAFDKLYELAHDVSSYPPNVLAGDDTIERTLFVNDKVLFLSVLLRYCEALRGMPSDFGIVPFPKYDLAQDSYYTVSHDEYSLLCVPATADPAKYQMIGAVTEAVAAEGYRTVTPAYFDIALKNKYSRDDESSRVLDILAERNTFQPAIIYSSSLGDIGHLLRGIIYGNQNIVSDYEKKARTYEKAFEKFNEKYAELD